MLKSTCNICKNKKRKNNRYMLKSTCNICKNKKKEILGSGFLSNLFSKIPILNKII